MNKFLVSCAAVAALGWPVWAQTVETEKPHQGQIIHLRTALDHLTVLEMSEPVSAVAVGSSTFLVEWRGNKVFIEPTDAGMATNLFVWTKSGRFNYELDPAGTVPEMIFAIDQRAANPPKTTADPREVPKPASPSPDEILMDMTPVRLTGQDSRKDRVAVFVTDILARHGQILIRYSIRNGTNQVYVPGSPRVAVLRAPRYWQSLYALRDYQLSPKEATRLRSEGATVVEVAKAGTHLAIKPDRAGTGIVRIKLPTITREPTVLELSFLAGPGGPVRAIVVL